MDKTWKSHNLQHFRWNISVLHTHNYHYSPYLTYKQHTGFFLNSLLKLDIHCRVRVCVCGLQYEKYIIWVFMHVCMYVAYSLIQGALY